MKILDTILFALNGYILVCWLHWFTITEYALVVIALELIVFRHEMRKKT